MKTRVVRLLTSSALVALAASASNAATITANAPDAQGRVFADIKGLFTSGDEKTFENAIGKNPDPKRTIVRLSGDEGAFLPPMDIAKRVATASLPTYVPKRASCAIVWLSGSPRAINDGDDAGFHHAYNANTKLAMFRKMRSWEPT
jgi:hypothetical protein